MEAIQFDSHTILKKINAISIDLYFALPPKHDTTSKTTMHIGWTPPPHGFFKLNTDGSVRNNPGDACAGGIIQDSHGRWISSCTRKIGRTHSMAVELWGLHDGLTLARNLNIRKLLVEVNASVIANFFSADYSMQDTTHPFVP